MWKKAVLPTSVERGRSWRSGPDKVRGSSTAVIAPVVPGRHRRAGSRHAPARGLVLRKAVQTLLVKLRIGDRSTLPAHARLSEAAAAFQQAIVPFAFHDAPPHRPVPGRGALRSVAHDLGIADTSPRWLRRVVPRC